MFFNKNEEHEIINKIRTAKQLEKIRQRNNEINNE